ncbi:hypothetical protein C8R47DRAFT_640795 [Mycena vitilis]|nr:hypothetical protein C8R47DRAFT_640795 [Mycena vitilis]
MTHGTRRCRLSTWAISLQFYFLVPTPEHSIGQFVSPSTNDPVPLHSILNSATISAAIKIGSLKPETVKRDILRSLLQPVGMLVPAIDQEREPEFTCRVWFREAICVLNDAEALETGVSGRKRARGRMS